MEQPTCCESPTWKVPRWALDRRNEHGRWVTLWRWGWEGGGTTEYGACSRCVTCRRDRKRRTVHRYQRMGVEEIKMAPFGIRGERDFVLSGRACGASPRTGHSSSLLKGGQTPWTARRKKQPQGKQEMKAI